MDTSPRATEERSRREAISDLLVLANVKVHTERVGLSQREPGELALHVEARLQLLEFILAASLDSSGARASSSSFIPTSPRLFHGTFTAPVVEQPVNLLQPDSTGHATRAAITAGTSPTASQHLSTPHSLRAASAPLALFSTRLQQVERTSEYTRPSQ